MDKLLAVSTCAGGAAAAGKMMKPSIDILYKIQTCQWYAFTCKHWYPRKEMEELKKRVLADEVQIRDGGAYWLISSTNQINPPASQEQIELVEQVYKASLPDEYKNFLQQTNGASLFTYQQRNPLAGKVTHCQLLSTSELIEIHEERWEVATDFLVKNDQDTSTFQYNFLPVAHVMDSHYICISLHPLDKGTVFMLYPMAWGSYDGHDYNGLFPSYTNSFNNWLIHVINTYGNEWANGKDCQ